MSVADPYFAVGNGARQVGKNAELRQLLNVVDPRHVLRANSREETRL